MAPLPNLLASLAHEAILLAQRGRLAHMGSRFREGNPRGDITSLLGIAAGLAVLGFAVWAFTRWHAHRETRPVNSPRKLFRELCRAHELGHADRKLLHEIAAWHGLADPVQLFFEPHRFQAAEMQQALACETEANLLHSQLFGISY